MIHDDELFRGILYDDIIGCFGLVNDEADADEIRRGLLYVSTLGWTATADVQQLHRWKTFIELVVVLVVAVADRVEVRKASANEQRRQEIDARLGLSDDDVDRRVSFW